MLLLSLPAILTTNVMHMIKGLLLSLPTILTTNTMLTHIIIIIMPRCIHR